MDTSTDSTVDAAVKHKGRRAGRTVTLYDRSRIPIGGALQTSDGATYGVAKDGAFVRSDKDHRSPKERKRARREARKES